MKTILPNHQTLTEVLDGANILSAVKKAADNYDWCNCSNRHNLLCWLFASSESTRIVFNLDFIQDRYGNSLIEEEKIAANYWYSKMFLDEKIE